MKDFGASRVTVNRALRQLQPGRPPATRSAGSSLKWGWARSSSPSVPGMADTQLAEVLDAMSLTAAPARAHFVLPFRERLVRRALHHLFASVPAGGRLRTERSMASAIAL